MDHTAALARISDIFYSGMSKETVDKLRHRQTTIRIAWQRLDDHIYPKGR